MSIESRLQRLERFAPLPARPPAGARLSLSEIRAQWIALEERVIARLSSSAEPDELLAACQFSARLAHFRANPDLRNPFGLRCR